MSNKGFSIIELVVVMIIVSIVAAVTIPLIFRGGATMTVAAMARKIKSDIQYAQEMAMARRASTGFAQPVRARIIFDTAAESYNIVMVNDADGDNLWGEAGPPQEWEYATDPFTRDSFTLSLNIPDTPYTGITINSASFPATGCTSHATNPVLEFDSLGIPYCVNNGVGGTSVRMDSPGSVSISKAGETATVNITQNTGRVSIL